eukprot:TRINITY_DN142_c0_g1_i1.p1 TRINITY_DN142_c0_g1~~TRINITY_DN142_c0_g1_i1.p1  ORF type:complete len:397 (+),score=160.18 TRINITY_DN142_c0_g1_i1:47-1237(+)
MSDEPKTPAGKLNEDGAAPSSETPGPVNPTPQNTPAAGGVQFSVPQGEGAGEGGADQLGALSKMFGGVFSGADLQNMLAGGLNDPQQFLKHLPKNVQRRAFALENLHNKLNDIWLEEQHELGAITRKFEAKYASIFEERRKIVVGEHEPTDEEAAPPADWEELADDEQAKVEEVKDDDDSDDGEEEPGIPEFWFQILQDNPVCQGMLGEEDADALLYLEDIKAETLETEKGKRAFQLTFIFGENEFFENTTLIKKYFLDMDLVAGQVLKRIESDEIKWKPGKCLTEKTVKKKQRNKKKQVRTITTTEEQQSFFNFFQSVNLDDEEDEQKLMAAQEAYELGDELYENVVPAAVKYWTGEAAEEGGMGGPEGESDEDDSEDESGGEGGEGGKPECKQS